MHDGSQCGLDAKCIYDPEYDHSTCHCNKGFVGDGFECEIFHQIVDKSECTRHSQCMMDEKCVLVSNLPNFLFKCIQPEYQEPQPIIPEEPKPDNDLCKSNRDCHQHADCIQDHSEQKLICECKEFYQGDGYNYCTPGPGNFTELAHFLEDFFYIRI